MQTFLSGGKPIRIQQIEPPSPGPHPAILLLHGSGGNIGFWLDRFAPHVSRLGIAFYAVHYFDRTGTTRADATTILDGRHFPLWLDTVRDALTYVASRPGIDPSRIALLGISLGAFLSLALATTTKVRAIVEISGGLPAPYSAQATSAFPPTLILHGAADTIVPVADAHALNALLDKISTPHQMQIFPGESHWFSPGAQLRILAAVAQFLGKYL